MDFEKIDIVESLQPLVDGGSWYWRADTMKLDRLAAVGEPRTPWVYWHPPGTDCYFHNDIIFKRFGILPSYCAECYKVVVVPKTVEELFQLCDIQQQLEGFPCKCGIEIREDVNRNYGGYWYNEGLKKGETCYELIREMITKYIGPQVRVALKRACTEYERKFGPSNEWEVPEGTVEFEERVRSFMHKTPTIAPQPEIFRKHVKDRWIHFAHSRGDMTYLKFTDGKPLYEPYVLYAGEL